ncbi:alpha/beta fold hydrolase [Ulvibacterium sp.]|uniref:alpha/beta fold hydrolase n=1 Tax=Ulvibacterium sp. TaxID=2665914 RepID=UPI003BAB6A47
MIISIVRILLVIVLNHIFVFPILMKMENGDLKLMPRELKTSKGTWSYHTGHSGEKAILFIHGASSSSRIWKYQQNLKIEGYKTIYVDLLGYGNSDKPQEGYSLQTWIDGIHAILEQEEVKEVVFVAHSNGVILAKEFYRKHPKSVLKMILVDGMLKQMIQPPMLEWMKSQLERSDYENFMQNSIQQMPVQGLQENDIEILKEDALNTPKPITIAEFDMVGNPDTWHKLIMECPVTIIHSNNPLWNQEYIAWLAEVVPKLDFLQWDDSGHFVPLQFPDRLNDVILDLTKK